MAKSLIKFRYDDDKKKKAIEICSKLGIDLTTYIKASLNRLIQENGIPFSMRLSDKKENLGLHAMKAANRIAEENGISDMTLDEINKEISEARK